jgi:hypothetical protein
MYFYFVDQNIIKMLIKIGYEAIKYILNVATRSSVFAFDNALLILLFKYIWVNKRWLVFTWGQQNTALRFNNKNWFFYIKMCSFPILLSPSTLWNRSVCRLSLHLLYRHLLSKGFQVEKQSYKIKQESYNNITHSQIGWKIHVLWNIKKYCYVSYANPRKMPLSIWFV